MHRSGADAERVRGGGGGGGGGQTTMRAQTFCLRSLIVAIARLLAAFLQQNALLNFDF